MEPQQNLAGNLVQDPAQTVTASGLKVTRFRMAASGRRYDRATGEWVSTDPVYISVVCWRQLGDNVMQSLRKGDSVVVMGRLMYREWNDEAGNRRNKYEIEASAVGPDLSRYVAQLVRPLRDLPEVPAPAEPDGAETSAEVVAA